MRGFSYMDDQSWIDREMTRGSDLPISLAQAKRVTQWLKRNYGPKIEAVTKDTPFPPYVICAITCQETAYFWLKMSEKLTADEVLARCVLDASGELPSDPRSAFPRNTDAFRAKFGDDFADMLIEEANITRQIRGMGKKEWVYKGYGIFQYDLQAITDDVEFFKDKQWYDIDCCLARVMQELKHKWARTHDLWLSVKAYNGSGSRADQYMRNVKQFAEVTKEVWLSAPGPDPLPTEKPVVPVVPVIPAAPVETTPVAATPTPTVTAAATPAPPTSPAQVAQPSAPATSPVTPPANAPATAPAQTPTQTPTQAPTPAPAAATAAPAKPAAPAAVEPANAATALPSMAEPPMV